MSLYLPSLYIDNFISFSSHNSVCSTFHLVTSSVKEIASLVKQLEQDTQELTEFCTQLLQIRRRKQEKRHWELVVQWFQQVAAHYSSQLQDCLKLRGEILAEQAHQRRKLVDTQAGNGNKKDSFSKRKINLRVGTGAVPTPSTPLFDSPLFTASSAPKSAFPIAPAYASNGSVTGKPARTPGYNLAAYGNGTAASSYYGTNASSVEGYEERHSSQYGGYPDVAGYGGNTYVSETAVGMRQRKGGMSTTTSTIPVQEQEEEEKVHSQIQMRQQKRQTQQRLDEARQAETMLGELGQMFGKMATLISQQGETLEKIEDDVECALVDVTAGQEELTKLYSIKKGNRPLIIKTFAILIFLIIFMKAYHKK